MSEIIIVQEVDKDEDLPVASTTDPDKILNSDEYAVFENVPVFVEHQRALKDGRTLQFGKKELQCVIDRSNQRITETGDFAPIVIGHTSNEPTAIKPPKIGWAGPFKLGWLTSAKDKYAILCDFRIEKDKVGLLKEYPRRSAEIWAEERYEDMYLDPISLLGAETPWSDMGVLYSKEGGGAQKVYYSITPQAPSAYSGLPEPVKVGKTSKKEKYSMDNTEGLTSDQQTIAQTIVNAILESPEFKFLRQQMEEANAKEDGMATDAPQKVEPIPDAQPLETEETAEGDASKKANYEMEGESLDGEEGDDTSAATQYAASEDDSNKKKKDKDPEDEEEEDEEEGEESDTEEEDYLGKELGDDLGADLDEGVEEDAEESDSLGSPLLGEDMGDEDYGDEALSIGDDYGEDESILGGAPGRENLSLVDEEFSGGDEDYGNYGSSEGELGGSLGGDEDFDDYEEGDEMANYDSLRREIAELRDKVKRLQKAFDWTTDQVVSRERYAKLADLRAHYVFDETAERKKCRYNKMNNKEFDARCDEIVRTHRPVPTSIRLPGGLIQNAPTEYADRPGAIQYSKETSEDIENEVMRLSDQYASKGISKTSEELRNEARSNCRK